MISECLLGNNYQEKCQEPLKQFPVIPTGFTDLWEKKHERNPCLNLLTFLFHMPETTPQNGEAIIVGSQTCNLQIVMQFQGHKGLLHPYNMPYWGMSMVA